MTEFRKGDRVSIGAEVISTDDDGVFIEVDGITGRIGGAFVWADLLTLVERPVREVMVTLTEEQAEYLYNLANGDITSGYVSMTATKLGHALRDARD